MSDSEGSRARLQVTSSNGIDELTVVDSSFRPVAEGSGTLTAMLDPGIYELVARAGPTVGRRLIKLSADEHREELAPDVPFPSTPPIQGSLAANARQLELVRAATGSVAGGADAAALCVFVRDAGDRAMGDLPALELRDAGLREVAAFRTDWRFDGSAATWIGDLASGGFALRIGKGSDAIDQSVWLVRGWTTIIFVAVDRGAVNPASVSIDMVPVGEEWSGGRSAAATELALWGLREGRWRAGESAIASIRRGTLSANPILGLATAYLLLEAPQGYHESVEQLVDELASAVDSPDVLALQGAAEQRGVRLAARPRPPIGWPPMLLASYLALLRRDATNLDAFAPGSIAERVAGTLTVRSTWTSWQPIAPDDHITPRLARTRVAPQRVLDKVARNPSKVVRSKLKDPASRRVAAFLRAVADLDDDGSGRRVARLSPMDIAFATGLPAATVDRSLRRIWLTISFTILPFIVTITAILGLLVVASIGVLVLGSGAGPPPSFVPSSPPVLLPEARVPDLFDIGGSRIGQVVRQEFPIRNVGAAPLTVLDFSLGGDAAREFGVDRNGCDVEPIEAGDECLALLTFTPALAGERTADLGIHTGEIGVVTVHLRGTGLAELLFDPPEVKGMGYQEQRRVFVGADGPIALRSITLAGESPGAFSLDATECEGAQLDAGTGCWLSVTYTPGGEGAATAQIEIVADDGRTWSIPLEGATVIF